MFNLKQSTLIALSAGSLFAAACRKPMADKSGTSSMSGSGEKVAKIQCNGANDCKGQSGCKTALNDCAGKNGCKGKGFITTASADECTSKGGLVASAK